MKQKAEGWAGKRGVGQGRRHIKKRLGKLAPNKQPLKQCLKRSAKKKQKTDNKATLVQKKQTGTPKPQTGALTERQLVTVEKKKSRNS